MDRSCSFDLADLRSDRNRWIVFPLSMATPLNRASRSIVCRRISTTLLEVRISRTCDLCSSLNMFPNSELRTYLSGVHSAWISHFAGCDLCSCGNRFPEPRSPNITLWGPFRSYFEIRGCDLCSLVNMFSEPRSPNRFEWGPLQSRFAFRGFATWAPL